MKRIRRLPTILGIFLVLVSLGAGVIAINQSSSWFLRAETETRPEQVKITNLTDTSFSVSWVTATPATGFIKYGSGQSLSFTASDDRDQERKNTQEYSTHHATLTGLTPQTAYFFKIGSGGKLFDQDSQFYQATTAPTIQTEPPASDIAHGKIIKAGLTPVEGAIVYLSLTGVSPQSTLSKSSGAWMISLGLARSADLNTYAVYDKQNSVENIFVQAGPAGTATGVTNTGRDNPIPDLTLGETYDFGQSAQTRGDQTRASAKPEPTPQSGFSLEGLASSPTKTGQALSITNPTQDEGITTVKPSFTGQAPAGEKLKITVESPNPQSETVTVDPDGSWEWSPDENLKPGEHTVTASYTDDQDQTHFLTRSFVVLAAADDDLPAIESTPSARTTPTPTPTATPSGRTSVPSTESGVPDSGYLTPTFLFLIMGLGLIFSGLVSHSLLKRRLN